MKPSSYKISMSSLCSLLRHARAYNYKTGGPPPKLSSLPWFLNNMKTVQFFCPDKNTSDKRKKERKKERNKERKNSPLCCGQNTIQRESSKKQTSRLQPQLDFLMRILPNLQFLCHQLKEKYRTAFTSSTNSESVVYS